MTMSLHVIHDLTGIQARDPIER